MSLVLQYKFDQADVTLDSSGNSSHLTNVGAVTSTVDATYGNVALFNNNYLQLAQPAALLGTSPRTVSAWINRSVEGNNTIFGSGPTSNTFELYFRTVSSVPTLRFGNTTEVLGPSLSLNTWHHVALTYDGTSREAYVNGVSINSSTTTVSTGVGDFIIGRLSSVAAYFFIGKMSDFRVYDYDLDATDISTMFANGPNFAPPPLTVTPRVSNVSTTILSVTGATGYRLTSQQTGSSNEIIVKDNFTDLVQTVFNLTPLTEYTIRLYSTEDGTVYTLVETVVVTTLANSSGNYDKNDYLSNGTFDITTLDDTSIGLISDVMNDVFTTGDVIDLNVSGKTKKSKFVNRGSNVDISDTEAIIAPFSTDGSSGQDMFLTLSDTSVVNVTYDETTEEVTIGNTSYNIGEYFVLDGKKVTIVDF